MSETTSGLVVEALTVTRGRKGVVQGVNLRCEPGEIVGLIGPNGAGKSTTFHALVGLVPCRADRLTLNGHDYPGWPCSSGRDGGLGYLPQGASGVSRVCRCENNLRAVMEIAVPREDRPALHKQLLERPTA